MLLIWRRRGRCFANEADEEARPASCQIVLKAASVVVVIVVVVVLRIEAAYANPFRLALSGASMVHIFAYFAPSFRPERAHFVLVF